MRAESIERLGEELFGGSTSDGTPPGTPPHEGRSISQPVATQTFTLATRCIIDQFVAELKALSRDAVPPRGAYCSCRNQMLLNLAHLLAHSAPTARADLL